MSGRRTAAFKLAAVILSAIAAFLVLEGAVRARQWLRYGSASPSVHVFETDAATGLRVPAAGSTRAGIVINSLGFRGPELPRTKPKATLRLAFLGASTTYCAEVSSNDATWPHLVAEALGRTYPHRRFDYVNAAAPGFSTEASLVNLRMRVAALDPDVIVIYHGTNDLSDDTRRLAREQGLFDGRADDVSLFAEWSTLWFLLEKNWAIRQRQRAARDASGQLSFDPKHLSRGFETRVRALVDEANAAASLTALVTFSHRLRPAQRAEEQLEASRTSLYYMPYMSLDGLLAGFGEYNRVIRVVARERNALLVGGENDIPGDDVHFADSVHFTDEGAVSMAERVTRALVTSPAFRALVANSSR